MANAGTIKLYVHNTQNEAGYLEWSVSSQSVVNNTSTISWKLYAEYTYSTYFVVNRYDISMSDASTTKAIQSANVNVPLSSAMTFNVASGSFTVAHDVDGQKSFNLIGAYSGYEREKETTTIIVAGAAKIQLPTISRAATILTASNFTDEDNPTITYNNPYGSKAQKLEACISLTGGNDDVPYREIPKTGTSYTFELTEDERNVLRMATLDTQTTNVRFYIKTTIDGTTFFSYVTRTFTVSNCNPIVSNPTIRDVNSDTVALTGNEDMLVRYESMAEYSFEAAATKYATITNQSVQCGNKKASGMYQGVIDDVESGTFIFSATDSRGATTSVPIEKTLVKYVKPTCYQKLTAELAGETGAQITLIVSGNYFSGSFGLVDNTIKLEMRYARNNEAMGAWTEITNATTRINEGDTYELETILTGFSYSEAYTFQCRITDKLNVVQSAQYTIKLLPVFDWSNDDFNFNVPINMNGETVLRHNADAKNTVLSASGGHIYIRPGGTDDTYGEIQITPSGDVYFNGSVYINGEEVGAAPAFADYIVEAGSEAMGSNGTWYWEKWNSGKAVCWGERNYGKVSCTTLMSARNLYKSAWLTQTFPTDLFTNVNYSSLTWACGADWGETDTSVFKETISNTSVSFVLADTSSGTLNSSFVSIYAIGRWK